MSCDTFVALPPATDGCVIFGKNSDRPPTEVQEVIYRQAQDHDTGATLQVTYLSVPQVPHTHAVLLSKPAWMWGAEMGANELGVCVGNEAVWTKLMSDADKEEQLLGMDLVRLALERASSADEAVTVITSLLEQYGQGGPCYEDPDKMDITYHNSFIVADGTEAWVLETAAKHWAAKRLTGGVRNLSNLLTLGADVDRSSAGLQEALVTAGLCEAGPVDFSEALSAQPPIGISCPGNESPDSRFAAGKSLMEQYKDGTFDTSAMISILRDQDAGICRIGATSSATMSSQVSVLYPGTGGGRRSVHWVTGTPNPAVSLFKPFVFCPEVAPTSLTESPTYGDNDPAKIRPRFQRSVPRAHPLYTAHSALCPLEEDPPAARRLVASRRLLTELESSCIAELEAAAREGNHGDDDVRELFKDAVESEIKFYPRSVTLN